jgi:hypothetical protein
MLYIGGYVMKNDPVAAAATGTTARSAAGYVAMAAVYLNAYIICATWQGITWTWASEAFPLDIRMLCVSLTTADTWLGSFIIARSTPYMISDLGYGAYFFFGAILICMGIWAFFCVPETKGEFLAILTHRLGVFPFTNINLLRPHPRRNGRPLRQLVLQSRLGPDPRQTPATPRRSERQLLDRRREGKGGRAGRTCRAPKPEARDVEMTSQQVLSRAGI